MEARDTLAPAVSGELPGPRSRALADRLRGVESRNVTFMPPVSGGPIFWERARGSNVWDVDGNRFVDLTAAFGVANVGHAHPRVVAALHGQAERLLHGMGDVHPPAAKVELLEALARLHPASSGGEPAAVRSVLGSSGSDAVETAIETAMLATGRPGVVAFEGAYHGLSLGTRDLSWRADFREPFAARLPGATCFARFGDVAHVREVADRAAAPIGAVLVEPVQGRGGERVPPRGFLSALRTLCDREGWLLIADEIYTGFGRTGRLFACEHEDVVPDLLCVGKGLSSGMPISACIGLAGVMEAWPTSRGEAIRTQTFLGHPLGCAAALASIAVLEEEKLVDRAERCGARALAHLRARLQGCAAVSDARGLGLMIGIECTSGGLAATVAARALARGVLVLPAGEEGRVLSITPPLSIGSDALIAALDLLCEELTGAGGGR